MKVLIAGDDPVSRRVLETTLPNRGYEPVVAEDGLAASEAMQDDEVPHVSILDWMIPRFDGIGLCRRIRDSIRVRPTYITLLRAWGGREDVTKGLEAGANGYVSKPFDRDEVRARLRIGERILSRQSKLADPVRELEEALARVNKLQGPLPICFHWKRIRDDQDCWQRVEDYLSEHGDVTFSHGIRPEWYERWSSRNWKN